MRVSNADRQHAPRTGTARTAARTLGAGLLLVVAACQGGERPGGGGTAGDTGGTAQVPGTAPTAGAAPGNSAPAGTASESQLVALGDRIFHGETAGGTCATCHGQGGVGTPIAPSLADAEWLHGDGSVQFLVNTVTTGVTTPKRYPGAMPPMGGAQLTADQVRAVAEYVYSLSRRSA